jgi:hypothetical protein
VLEVGEETVLEDDLRVLVDTSLGIVECEVEFAYGCLAVRAVPLLYLSIVSAKGFWLSESYAT